MFRNKLKTLLIIFGLIAPSNIAIGENENFLYLLGKNKDLPQLKFENFDDKKFFLAQTKLNWEYFEEEINKNKIFWKKYNDHELLEFNKKSNSIIDSETTSKFLNNPQKFKYLDYGQILPTANTLDQGHLRIEIGQVSPNDGGFEGGTGNQNYYSYLAYGIDDSKTIKIFYTEADDPLYKKINGKSSQPENLWTNFGAGFKWNFLNSKKFKLAIDSSLERWRVKSGGCNGAGCNSNSNNIFNNNLEPVDNTNTIYSLSLPISYKPSNNYEFSFAPRVINLPKEQSNEAFYGTSTGISLGTSITISKKLSSYFSSYFPLGESLNSFDENINYSKKIINTLGIRYSFDNRTALEGFITNSFGQTPATSILTLPSTNNYMLGGRLVYYPINNDNYSYEYKERKPNFNTNREGLSVSNLNKLNPGKFYFYSPIFIDGSTASKLKIGLSKNFILDFSSDKIPQDFSTSNNFERDYFQLGERSFRVGGLLTTFSEEMGDSFSSGFRLSFGRSLGATKPGYLFAELVNSKNLSKNLILNFNPKIANTGNGDVIGLGLSLNYKFTDWLTLIPEANIGLKNAENNQSIILRKKITNYLEIDSIVSNSFSPNDMGQLFKSKDTKYGINFTLKWF